MAGKPMHLDAHMPAFSENMTHDRTLKRWAERFDIKRLEMGLVNCLYTIASQDNVIELYVDSFAFPTYLFDQVNKLSAYPLRGNVHFDSEQTDWRIGNVALRTLFTQPLNRLDLNNPTLQILMCVGAYRALIQKRQGFLPGSQFNITMAGAVAMAVNVGVVQEPT